MLPASVIMPCASLRAPFIRIASSGVSSGRETSCVERLTFVDQPRPLVVICSLTTVVCPVSFERCSAVSMLLGANAHWTWQVDVRSEEHTSELQSHLNLVCRLLLEKKKI